MLRLKNKGALIVGAKRVGGVVARRLAQDGVNLAIAYRGSKAEAEQLYEEVRPKVARACLIQGDLALEADVERIVATSVRELGDLSFVINLASEFLRTPRETLTSADWDRAMIGARGSFLLALHASRHMMRNVGPTRGHLIHFGDWAAIDRPYRDYLPYLAGKAIIHYMTSAFAVELAPHGILVNCIAPGATARPPDISATDWAEVLKGTPLGRASSAEEMAEMVALLLKSETITGEVIRVDSGSYLGPA